MFYEGDEGNEFFIILKGKVAVYKYDTFRFDKEK